MDYAGVEAKLDRVQGANVWITLGLREGKNREVKRLLEHLGLATNRLIRLSYGPFQLGETPEGAVEEVRTRVLADQLGATLAQEAGVDFDGPVIDRTPEPEYEPERRPTRDRRPASETRAGGTGREKVRPEKKMGTEKPGPRKHVTALRSERDKAEKGPRRRIESGATEDRRGRKVVVERVSAAGPRAEPQDTRNARRFRAEREKTEAPATNRPRRARAARVGKACRRDRRGQAFPPRRRSRGDERSRRPGFCAPARRRRPAARDFSRPRGEKPSRGFGEQAGGRPSAGRKAALAAKPSAAKPAGGRAARRQARRAANPFGGKPTGGSPSGGKPLAADPRWRQDAADAALMRGSWIEARRGGKGISHADCRRAAEGRTPARPPVGRHPPDLGPAARDACSIFSPIPMAIRFPARG